MLARYPDYSHTVPDYHLDLAHIVFVLEDNCSCRRHIDQSCSRTAVEVDHRMEQSIQCIERVLRLA